MEQALELARAGSRWPRPIRVWARCWSPRDGEIVGRGFHTYDGKKHAEVLALEEAGDTRARRDAVPEPRALLAYRTHRAVRRRVIAAGIKRVVVAMRDPNPLVGGRGFAKLRAQESKFTKGCSNGGAQAERGVREIHSPQNSVRHAEDGDDAGRQDRAASAGERYCPASLGSRGAAAAGSPARPRAHTCTHCATPTTPSWSAWAPSSPTIRC